MARPKVFGIGFHKTATSSLAEALKVLGYRVTGPNGAQDPDIAETLGPLTRDLSARYDAFQDNPWPLVYAEMDRLHPGSRFVLTVRDPDRWIASVVRHFGDRSTPMREMIYGPGKGAPLGHEAHYVARMQQHNDAVLRYFADRPEDLLVVDLTRGDGWEALCGFLGHPVPGRPFPHANTAAEREAAATPAGALRRRLRRLGRRLLRRLLRRPGRS